MRRLNVYLNQDIVGTLDQNDDGRLEFRYDPAWLARAIDSALASRARPMGPTQKCRLTDSGRRILKTL
mgnify:CR=1 FL=1